MKLMILSVLLLLVAPFAVKALVNITKKVVTSYKSGTPIFYLLSNQMGSFSIPENFVEGFSETIYMLSQQKTPRLFGLSRVESQASEVDSYERISPTESNDILDRHGDTPLNNTPHSRRQVVLEDADWADLIDRKDDIRLLIDPTNAYTLNGNAALNRKKDDIFIAAALGIARAGKKGTISVSLPDSQKIVAVDDAGGGSSKFNVFTLTLMSAKFDAADVDEDITKYFAWSGKAKQQLLNDTKATSSDFASVKALVEGNINEFMGFLFRRSERLPVTSAATNYDAPDGQVDSGGGSVLAAGARRCVAWAEDGMISSIGEELFVDVGIRRDKRMSKQIYLCHSVGAVRMEEEKILEVLIDETL